MIICRRCAKVLVIFNKTVCGFRCLALSSKGAGIDIFDRQTKCNQRDLVVNQSDFDQYSYLKREIGYRIADRVYDITKFFDIAVDLGCGLGFIAPHIFKENVGHLVQVEMSSGMLGKAARSEEVLTSRLNADEELVPFSANSVDLFLSSLSMHWINNLPGYFNRMFRCLRQDGAFIGGMFGGDTLYELRCSLQLAEQDLLGGVAPHISPFTQVADIGALLNRAGFKMLTVDVDELTVNYPSMIALMKDLQGMGESNAAWRRPLHLRRDVMCAAEAIYKEMYGNEDGSLPATFQILCMIGWKPGPNMAQPVKRGSATVSLKDIDKLIETGGSKIGSEELRKTVELTKRDDRGA